MVSRVMDKTLVSQSLSFEHSGAERRQERQERQDTTITVTPFLDSQPTSSSATPGSSPWKSSGKSRHSISAVPFSDSQEAHEAGDEAEQERRRTGRRRSTTARSCLRVAASALADSCSDSDQEGGEEGREGREVTTARRHSFRVCRAGRGDSLAVGENNRRRHSDISVMSDSAAVSISRTAQRESEVVDNNIVRIVVSQDKTDYLKCLPSSLPTNNPNLELKQRVLLEIQDKNDPYR